MRPVDWVDHALGVRHLDAAGALPPARTQRRPAGMPPLSRVTWSAGLSLRRPRNMAWRTWPSGVQSANATSATSCGLTQRSAAGARAPSGWARAAAAANGGFGDLELRQPLLQVAPRSCAFQPVPTLPA